MVTIKYNSCPDLMQKAINFDDVAIVSVKRNDYRIHLWCMNKDDICYKFNEKF